MEERKRKYAPIGGASVPDLAEIIEAASDFTMSGVSDVNVGIHNQNKIFDQETGKVIHSDPEALSELQRLGNEVAETATAEAAESKRRMEAIMNSAVSAPESLADLRSSVKAELDAEKRKALEEEEAKRKAMEEEKQAKIRAREERRLRQKEAVEQLKARKAASDETKEEPLEETSEGEISSAEDTLDSFSEFL